MEVDKLVSQISENTKQVRGYIPGAVTYARAYVTQQNITSESLHKNHFDLNQHIQKCDMSNIEDFPQDSLAKKMGPPIEFFKVNSVSEKSLKENVDRKMFESKTKSFKKYSSSSRAVKVEAPGMNQYINLSQISTKQKDMQKMSDANALIEASQFQ